MVGAWEGERKWERRAVLIASEKKGRLIGLDARRFEWDTDIAMAIKRKE